MVAKEEGGGCKIGGGDEELQTSSYQIYKPQGCNTQHREYGKYYCNNSV